MRRGIEAPDLHPEAIFPGSFLPHIGSLPHFWRWIRSFRQVLMAAQLSPGLGCSCLGSRNQGRTQDNGSLAVAWVSSCQGWLPDRWWPERAIEQGGLK